MHSPTVVKSRSVEPLNVLGTEVRFLSEGQKDNGAWSLMEVTLPLNSGPPPHTHDWEEAYFVLEGAVEFIVNGERFEATEGDFVHTPGGVAHGFSGTSPRPARVLIFDAPAHAGAFFRRVDREVRHLPRDLHKVIAIGNDTGIHFSPSPQPAQSACSGQA